MKDIKLEDELPISAMQYFTHFIEPPDAKFQYLASKQHHSDVVVGPWVPCGTHGVYERVSTFSANLSNNALVKKLTGSVCLKVKETQRYHFDNQGDLHVESTMEFGGSSLAESFSSNIEWVVHTLPTSHCQVRCYVKTEYKGFMFKGLIEKYIHQTASDSFHHWLKAVREKIAILEEIQEQNNLANRYDQNVPEQLSYAPSSSPIPTDIDDDDDEEDVFYDSLEMAPPSSYRSTITPPPHEPIPTRPLHSSSSSIPSHTLPPTLPPPPLTATLPLPSTAFSSSNPKHAILTAYHAGRPSLTQQRSISPPSSFTPPTPSTLSSSSSSVAYASQTRGWESAAETEKRQEEEYTKRISQLVTQTREREREVDERIARMTRRIDAQARRTRWMLAVLAAFAVVWPALARALLRVMRWLWPLFKQRFRR